MIGLWNYCAKLSIITAINSYVSGQKSDSFSKSVFRGGEEHGSQCVSDNAYCVLTVAVSGMRGSLWWCQRLSEKEGFFSVEREVVVKLGDGNQSVDVVVLTVGSWQRVKS